MRILNTPPRHVVLSKLAEPSPKFSARTTESPAVLKIIQLKSHNIFNLTHACMKIQKEYESLSHMYTEVVEYLTSPLND